MSLSKPELSSLRLRPFVAGPDEYKRPQQVHKSGKYYQVMLVELGHSPSRETTATLSHKADGWSGLLVFDLSSLQLRLQLRKEGGGTPVPPLPAQRYLNEVAAGYESIVLHVEIVACLHGNVRRELGHALVPSAMEAFVANGCENTGPLHMCLRVFGLCWFRLPHGRPQTARNSPFRFVEQLVRRSNGLLDVVENHAYTVRLAGGNLQFRTAENKLVAGTHHEFEQYALRLAGARGYEGWVLQFAEDYFELAESEGRAWKCPPTYDDSFGKPRERCKLKIKQLPLVHGLAVKVNNAETDEMAIWLYGRAGSRADPEQRLRYLANVTDHPVIAQTLDKQGKTVGPNYRDKQDRQQWYQPPLAAVINAGLAFSVQATGLSTRGYIQGVKFTGTRLMPSICFAELSTPDDLLGDNPHALAVKACVREYRTALENGPNNAQALEYGDSNPFAPDTPMAARKQKKPLRVPVARSPSPPAKVQRALTPERPAQVQRAPTPVIAHDAVILLDPYVFGPARAALLKRVLRKSMPKAKFVNAAGRSVTLVVSDGPGIGRMPGPCRCSDIKALCHPDVQFATKEQALRPSGR